MRMLLTLLSLHLWAGTAVAAPSTAAPVGILVMAHGGKPDWEAGLLDALKDLRRRATLEVAFGMASAPSLQEAAARLHERGARRIAVVRLFVSGESFLAETRQILGLSPGAPARPKGATAVHAGHHDHGPGSLWRVESTAEFALSRAGLMDSPEMGRVLAKRAAALSRDPRRESVLILAHGPEDDAENGRWLAKISGLAAAVGRSLPFRDVRVETLREDWPEKRAAAERRIQDYVRRGAEDGKVLVVPFRVLGFGPYARVLKGLDYVADEVGLLPDAAVADWIAAQAVDLAQARGWPDPLADELAPTQPGKKKNSK